MNQKPIESVHHEPVRMAPEPRAHRVAAAVAAILQEMSTSGGEVLRIAAERNITHLVHFTQTENLVGICRHGLLPRALRGSNTLNVAWRCSDPDRRDGIPEANCLSVMHPNSLMLDALRRSRGDDWAVLGFRAEPLLRLPRVFCAVNASTGMGVPLLPAVLAKRATPLIFSCMFENKARRKQAGVPDYMTTDPQAEILILQDIGVDFLDYVAFAHAPPQELQDELRNFVPEVRILSPESELSQRLFSDHPAAPFYPPRRFGEWLRRKTAEKT